MATFMAPETPVVLENGEIVETTWRAFVAANADGEVDLADIEITLAAGETFYGGGGAEPEWSIRRADEVGAAT